MYLPTLTDEELLRHAENLDPLVKTDLEAELGQRLASILDEQSRTEPLVAAMSAIEIDSFADVAEILEVMGEFSCYDASDVRAKLQRADKFYDIASDLQGDVLDRLTTLVRETA